MNTKELIQIITSRHDFDISQVDVGLLVIAIDGEIGNLMIIPNYDEHYHVIHCVAKTDNGCKTINLIMHYDKQWKLQKGIDDRTGLEADNLVLIEKQLNELIEKLFLASHKTFFMVKDDG